MATRKAAKPAAKQPTKKQGGASKKVAPAKDKIDAFGIDALCAIVADGVTLTSAAAVIGVSIGTLISWIEADPERSARAREARVNAARIWDEKAVEGIESAQDPFELSKAKEIAYHYRWRAAKIAPKEYGDKVQQEVTGPNGGPQQHEHHVTISAEDAYKKMLNG